MCRLVIAYKIRHLGALAGRSGIMAMDFPAKPRKKEP
jgi:hypothetical protein